MKINLNDIIRFKPTEAGRLKYFRCLWKYTFLKEYKMKPACELKIDEQGYAEMHLWEFMSIFGEMLYMGAKESPVLNNEIEVQRT